MARAESYGDYADDDKDSSRQSRPEQSRPQTNFKSGQRPQRKGSSISFNGLHRRRKKRIQW